MASNSEASVDTMVAAAMKASSGLFVDGPTATFTRIEGDDHCVPERKSATEDADEGLLTVFSASNTIKGSDEDDDFALIGAHHGCEAVTGETISAEPVEAEPGVPSPATCKKIIEVMTRPEVINYCAKVLLPRRDLKPAHIQILLDDTSIGLQTFDNCADEWEFNNGCIQQTRKSIIYKLHRVPVHTQWCTARVIEKLFRCDNWIKHEKEVLEYGDFEVSATLWLFKMGVSKLALGGVEPPSGRQAVQVAPACEEEWLLENVSDEEKTELRGFASDLLLWGYNIEALCEESNEEE